MTDEPSAKSQSGNIDPATVQAFSEQWDSFDRRADPAEKQDTPFLFEEFFSLFPWDRIGASHHGIEIGSGPGRFAQLVAPRVGHLTLLDAAAGAHRAARKNLEGIDNVTFVHAALQDCELPDASMDFAYSHGVLHHIPDTPAAVRDCVRLLKPGAPFLVYLYYRFDNRPTWFRLIWRLSNILRVFASSLPGNARHFVCDLYAVLLYWPLARFSRLVDRLGIQAANLPLWEFRDQPMNRLRALARDRFGTPLEQRFTQAEMREILETAGLENIEFLDGAPYWTAIGYKRH